MFDYLVVSAPPTKDALEMILDRYGSAGWRLVQVLSYGIIFEKEKPVLPETIVTPKPEIPPITVTPEPVAEKPVVEKPKEETNTWPTTSTTKKPKPQQKRW